MKAHPKSLRLLGCILLMTETICSSHFLMYFRNSQCIGAHLEFHLKACKAEAVDPLGVIVVLRAWVV